MASERVSDDLVVEAILALEPLQVLSDDAAFAGAQVARPAAMAESALRTQRAELEDARRERDEAREAMALLATVKSSAVNEGLIEAAATARREIAEAKAEVERLSGDGTPHARIKKLSENAERFGYDPASAEGPESFLLYKITRLESQRDGLVEAAKDFVNKCETGRARSVDSLAKFRAALAEGEPG